MDLATTPPFERLLQMARDGDDAALGQLLDRYRTYLTVLAQVQIGRRLQGKVEAADLTQETFLEAHRAFRASAAAGESEFTSWLRQILATTIAHQVRRYFSTKGRDVRLERKLSGGARHLFRGARPRLGGEAKLPQPAGMPPGAGSLVGCRTRPTA